MEKCNHNKDTLEKDILNSKEVMLSNTIHKSKLVCKDCGRWIKFVPKDKNLDMRNRTSKYSIEQVLKFHKKDKEFCFFCLREKHQLGQYETMTIDHIEELSKAEDEKDLDILENLQILCSACHKLKNWARLYMNWHFHKNEDDTQ